MENYSSALLLSCIGVKYQFNRSFRYQKRVSNIIDDVLEWSPRLALSGMMDKQQTVMNATEPNSSSPDASQSTEEMAPSDSVSEENTSDQNEAEAFEHLDDADQHKRDDNI